MNSDIKKFIERHYNVYIEMLKSTIAIRSVLGEPTKDAPFGIGPKLCLEHVLAIAKTLGFRVKIIDNAVGYVEYGPEESEAYLGIFGHLDVVDEGTGWDFDPYTLTESNGKFYARGVLDNKGPILGNLFALYALKELGVQFKNRVRIVFGTNEETGMNDIPIYLKKEKPPYFGWTPDCKFPLIYGERGRMTVRISEGDESEQRVENWINTFLLSKNPVDSLNIGFTDPNFGKLILRNVIKFEKAVEFTLSYPNLDKKMLINRIKLTLQGLNMSIVRDVEPVIYDVDENHVSHLEKTLKTLVDFDTKPVTTTGGTYAKLVPHIIAYGPSFPGQNGIAHLPNEWVDCDDLFQWILIYAHSIYSFKGE